MLDQFEMQAVQASEAEAMKQLWHIEQAHMADMVRAVADTAKRQNPPGDTGAARVV